MTIKVSPTPNLDQMMEVAITTSKKIIVDNQSQELMPTFLIMTKVNGENHIDVVQTPWRSDEHKVLITEALRFQFKLNGVIAYIHVSEAWMRNFPIDTDLSKVMAVSKYEDQKEILIIVGQDIDDNRVSIVIDIERDANNVRSLGERNDMPAESMRGRMVSLLSEDTDGR